MNAFSKKIVRRPKTYKHSRWWNGYRKDIAREFYISEHTVKHRIENKDPEVLEYLINEGLYRNHFSDMIKKKFALIDKEFSEKAKKLPEKVQKKIEEHHNRVKEEFEQRGKQCQETNI